MNIDNIISMAKEAEIGDGNGYIIMHEISGLARFADIVAAAERKECAKVCDSMILYTGFDCAAAIRARGHK